MRIALITDTFAPEINGVARTLDTLTAELARAGHQVLVLRPAHHGEESGWKRWGQVRVATCPSMALPRYPSLRLAAPAVGMVRRYLSRFEPEIAYVATEGPLGYAGLRACQQAGLPRASGYHTRFDTYTDHYSWLGSWAGAQAAVKRYLRWFHRQCDITLVPTQALRDELRGAGYGPISIWQRAVDTQTFHPRHHDASLRRSWDANLMVGYLGRLAPEKNLDLAVAAISAITADVDSSRMIWIGDGPSRVELQRNRPHDIFTGGLRGDSLSAAVASLDLLLVPSRSETFGNVVLEGMASGLPVVAFNQAAAADFIDSGVNGLTVAVDDNEAFIDQSLHLAQRSTLREHLGRRARERVASCSWPNAAHRFAGQLMLLRESQRAAA